MFDYSSRMLLREAPNLSGLDSEILDELLTEAYTELATARRLEQEGNANLELFDRVRRLASTFEVYVALNLRPEQTRAAAFVAGTAHQILTLAREPQTDQPTLVSSYAIGSAISATLLFLIAGRLADAAEVATKLRAGGESMLIRRLLIRCIREFATGKLTQLIGRNLDVEIPRQTDSHEYATNLLLRECAQSIQHLAREAYGEDLPSKDVRERLAQVISLSEAASTELAFGIDSAVYHQFAGPHHLATLLTRLIDGVQASMLVRLPPPAGTDHITWSEWKKFQARSKPFLWVNHLKAIETGYLDRHRSMVMTSPTGSGKTTLSVLKIASTLCAGKSVVYLAPTHALVDQVEVDLSAQIGDLQPVVNVEDTALEELGERLPPFSVMTPERCLALLGFAPELFSKVELLVFDEFHLIGAEDPSTSSKVSARAIDAMLALLTFIKHRKKADLLLLSAMVANGTEIASWLENVTGREVQAFNDPWKPTRQLRSCVIYDNSEVIAARQRANRMPTKGKRNRILVQPLGLFSLISGWHPTRPEKLVVRLLTEHTPALVMNDKGYLTSNRNEVAARIAADYALLGKRVIVFCNDSKACGSVADEINRLLTTTTIQLDEIQEKMQNAVLKDVGSKDATFDPTHRRAAVHHGDLLPLERRLTESIFRMHRDEGPNAGLNVIAATSTIAQGLNLPCDVVILAGTDRSAVDDPNGNPRSDLRPHEILNALGRAGRAAYAATGLSIVVPAQPIRVDLDQLDFKADSVLSTIFSDKDACETIFDPIEILLDQVEISANSDVKVQAMIRRLSSVTTDGGSGFDDIVRRSFGYFRKKTENSAAADRWLVARRAALKHAEDKLEEEAIIDWQQDIGVRNGIPPILIGRLVNAFETAPMDKSTTVDWINWVLDVIAEHPLDLNIFVRKEALDTVFGRAYSNQNKPKKTARLILGALKKLVSMWCGGRSLVEIEAWLLNFIRENEGPVKQRASHSVKAQRARRFAIRIAPDLGFLCGVLAQIANHLSEEEALVPPVIDMLPQMIRAGDYDRHHAALRQTMTMSSRVETYELCEELRPNFSAGPSSSGLEIKNDITLALLLS